MRAEPRGREAAAFRDLRATGTRASGLRSCASCCCHLVYDRAPSRGFGRGDGGDDDEPIALPKGGVPSVPTHVAFTASDPDQVDAFHAAALAAGGRDNGAPGERPYGGYYYAAFVLDPDGHNIEAVYHGRERRRPVA